jgi:hypothetical protein
MRNKLLALLLATIGLLAYATTAQALESLNDPLVTPGTPGDRLILDCVTCNTTLQSIPFSITGSNLLILTVDVTACSTCSMRLNLEAQDGNGVWYAYWAGTATDHTAVAIRRYILSPSMKLDGVSISDMAGTSNIQLTRPMPTYFRIRMVWTSGTSASYTVQGVTY